MTRRAALAFLACSSPAILLAFVAGTPAGDVVFALLAMAFPVALIALGAQRRGSLGPLLWPLAALALVLEGCIVAMLMLRGQVLAASWFGGLPLAAAVQFYGLFLLPLFIVSLAYAWTFERFGLRQEDLDDLRRRFGSVTPASLREDATPVSLRENKPEDE